MTRGRILVVEDDPAIEQTIALILSEEGYTIATAGDGAAALAGARQDGRGTSKRRAVGHVSVPSTFRRLCGGNRAQVKNRNGTFG